MSQPDTQHKAAIERAIALHTARSAGHFEPVREQTQAKLADDVRAIIAAYDAARSGPAADGIETWMVDYEHGDGEPQHAVLSWLNDEAKDLPEVGTQLVRKSDYDTLAAARSGEREEIVLWTCVRCERIERLHDGDERPECCGEHVRLGERAEQEHEPTPMLAAPFIRAARNGEAEGDSNCEVGHLRAAIDAALSVLTDVNIDLEAGESDLYFADLEPTIARLRRLSTREP